MDSSFGLAAGIKLTNTVASCSGGEALIMTALGLAVAIPAVLAYNTFVRRNRIWLARLDAFAHDLFVLIAVGAKTNSSAGDERQLRVVVPVVAPAAVPGERRS